MPHSHKLPKMEKEYTSYDGTQLVIENATYNICGVPKKVWVIVWEYNNGDAVIGSYLNVSMESVSCKSDWEMLIANKAAGPLSQGMRGGFYFNTKKQAVLAKNAVITALLAEDWLPSWAQIAKKEGWVAPENWKAQLSYD